MSISSTMSIAKGEIPFPSITRRSTINLGYVRLLDAAPYIVAQEMGYFRDHGLHVDLSMEVGWATIRNKLSYGELDAAQALAPLPLAMSLGLSSPAIPTQALMVTSRNGNAVTLSEDLWKRDVRTIKDLAREIKGTRAIKRYTFGVVSAHSCHDLILRQLLRHAGIKPEEDVQIVNLPPDQMVRCLASGNIDGFCVGEPWNSLAVQQGIGWCLAVSADLHPGHPEKVLACTRDFIGANKEMTRTLVNALHEACAWCDNPNNQDQLVRMLSSERNLSCHPDILRHALSPSFPLGHGQRREKKDFMVFHRNNANRPCDHQAEWILNCLQQSGHLDGYTGSLSKVARETYDPTFYDSAISA